MHTRTLCQRVQSTWSCIHTSTMYPRQCDHVQGRWTSSVSPSFVAKKLSCSSKSLLLTHRCFWPAQACKHSARRSCSHSRFALAKRGSFFLQTFCNLLVEQGEALNVRRSTCSSALSICELKLHLVRPINTILCLLSQVVSSGKFPIHTVWASCPILQGLRIWQCFESCTLSHLLTTALSKVITSSIGLVCATDLRWKPLPCNLCGACHIG